MQNLEGFFFNLEIFFIHKVLLVLFTGAGHAGEERTDAGGQWMYVLEDGGVTITGYAEEPIGDLVIPGELDGYPVIGIGEDAFYRRDSLTSVTISEGVTRIDGGAFYWCESLASAIIPDSVTSIGEWAFKECYTLTNVTIGSNVTSIGGFAFFGCESLRDVAIPASVTDIGEYTFAECEELILTVTEGSFAEQYAQENNIPYAFAAD